MAPPPRRMAQRRWCGGRAMRRPRLGCSHWGRSTLGVSRPAAAMPAGGRRSNSRGGGRGIDPGLVRGAFPTGCYAAGSVSVQVFQSPAAQTEPLPASSDTNPLSVLSESERLHFGAVHQVARAEVAPLTRAMEREGRIPAELVKTLSRYGFFGVVIPEQLGGSGQGLFDVALTVEALAQADAAVALLVDVHNTMVAGAINRFGQRSQRFRHLPKLAGDRIGAFSLSEAHAGSDAFALRTTAERVRGGFSLNGSKAWVSGGREAGLFLVFARVPTGDGTGSEGGVTAFLVDRESDGLTVGPPESKVGLKASSTTPLFFKDCLVAEEDVLGEVGGGQRLAMSLLNEGRIGIAAQLVGVGQAALELAVSYAREREAFGRKIGRNQAVAFALANAATQVETARLATWNAARLADQGNETRYAAAMAKLTAQRMAESVTSLAIEIHGGTGYTTDCLAEKLWRDAKAGTIYEGTENMQLTTIAHGFRF